ncbi:MAG: biopolymer transporter ExbD [Betaproteobacteria bacterium]|nr:biopolymer transporter ExbD [Betaproteobacteria bacterium]
MALGQFSSEDPAKTISEINTTPFVDVMLVLLIIFIITAPLISQGLPLTLPQADAPSLPTKAQTVRVEITAQGVVTVDGQTPGETPTTKNALESLLSTKAQTLGQDIQLEIRADGATAYARVAEVIAAAQAVGLRQIGLVTMPEPPAAVPPGSAPRSPQTR